MLHLKSSVATLSILVAVVTALPYEWERADRYRWNDLFAALNQETAVRTQALIEPSACATITETKSGQTYRVRLCTADPEDAPNKVCLGTRVNPCCAGDFGRGSLVSSNKVNVAGEDITVDYFLTDDRAAGLCYRLDDAHLRSETCSRSRLEGISCLPPCLTITTTCFNNTVNGDQSSCVNDVCECKTGYLPPDCCQCDLRDFYLPDCKPFCRLNCASFRPSGLSGCAACNPGYVSPPECCDCDTVGNATHAFYKTSSGECLPYCKNNCAVTGSSGCVICKVGYKTAPECCDCDTVGNDTHAFYKSSTGECLPYCKKNCAVTGSSGCVTCKVGYQTAPECCDCDTVGNDTHAFYKSSTGECLPYCKKNCAVTGSSGCVTCRAGYQTAPECCDCDTVGNDTHAFYKSSTGECLPYCKKNCAVTGSSGCVTCKAGYRTAPECCDCDTAGNDTHAFYKSSTGECLPYCKSNCAVTGSSGCVTCKTGYQTAPECCDCDTTGNDTHAFYKTSTGECKPYCKKNCAVTGSNGCASCKNGYEAVPECCRCRDGFTEQPDGTCAPPCSINQNIYFLLDGTRQNYAFCTFGITIHMLVAAFNPGSSSSGTRLSTVLFPRDGESNVVFGTSNSCGDIKSKLTELQTQMQTCQDIQQPDKSSITYTSLCGSNTVAVPGLDKIRSLIPNPATTDSAVVILTDGVIDDSDSERVRALNSLGDSSLRVQTIISGGIRDSGATEANLRLYNRDNFANDGFVLAIDAVSLGVGLVRKMEEVGLLCPELADQIATELGNAQRSNRIRDFCQCHNIRIQDLLDSRNQQCIVGYPTCGGPVSISTRVVPKQQESLSHLEEEILAAVENVLEQKFEG